MTLLSENGSNHEEEEVSDEVSVNKKPSFNGRLNRYFYRVSKPGNASTASSDSSSAADDAKKREQEGQSAVQCEADTSAGRTKRSKSGMPYSPPSSPSRAEPYSVASSRTRTRLARKHTSSSLKNTQSSSANGPSSSSPTNLLRDTIPPGLILLLIGVNPSIRTGATGFAYAHPSNLFWKLLHSSGITSARHPPSDTYKLPELYRVGNTNIVERPTRDQSMLSRKEMEAGVPVLEAKVAQQRPQAVCMVGKSIWEAVWRVRKGRPIRKEEFHYGWQPEEENMGKADGWKGAPVFVATTTSGLAAGMSMQEKEAIWKELGGWVVKTREEQNNS